MSSGLLQGALVQAVLVYQNALRFSSTTVTSVQAFVDAAGVSSIGAFAAASGSYIFENGNTIRLLGASPVQRWTYIGGDKTSVASYIGPVLESFGGAGNKTEQIAPTGANVTITHDDSKYFTLTVFDDPAGTTLDDITGVIEKYPTIVGTIKILNPNERPFILGANLDPDTSDTQVSGWYKTATPFDTEQFIDYYRAGGKLYLKFRETGDVEVEG